MLEGHFGKAYNTPFPLNQFRTLRAYKMCLLYNPRIATSDKEEVHTTRLFSNAGIFNALLERS